MRWLIVVAALAAVQPSPVTPTHLSGEYWTHLSVKEKDAYLSGFIAGAAAEQARAAAVVAHRELDSLAVSSAGADSLRAQSALRYHLAPQVYQAQIDDFYWWQDHATVPIVDAMIVLNRAMLDEQRR